MIFVDLCRIKGIFSDIQREEKQYSLARHSRRANFFVRFQNFFLKIGFVPNSNRQKYCSSCSKKVHRRQKNESARKRKADN